MTSVIRAIGQERHRTLFEAFGLAHERGVPIVDGALRTSDPRVYAVGDAIFASGVTDAMVVTAASQGKAVAANVDRELRDSEVTDG